ncbi:MAG: NADH-ubiquinone oxidoreductase-F iron-sulfur binding region domain-containing protein [Acidimicrobiales bacterium]
MTVVHRVLPPAPVRSLEEHLQRRGGRGIDVASSVEPEAIIDELETAGLRGRGGAGFPTAVKWRTVRENASGLEPTTVVVNGAEGEPGTFKDRTILALDPYEVIEGALIAASAVGADRIVFGLKRSFGPVVTRVRDAIAEVQAAGWGPGIEIVVFEGPDEYLYGEETALLETIDGRYPFPRIAPPFRRGVDEVVEEAGDLDTGSGLSGHVEMAGPGSDAVAPPALVDNVETLANVPGIIARGGSWFRTEGTDRSPGTIVCTVTGRVQRSGVAEFIMGTTLREVIDEIGGGMKAGRSITAVMGGVSNALITPDQLDTPLTYEDMAAIGSGLGSTSFIVYDDEDDLVAVVAGASRFLAVESCGQCTPCKQGGLVLADLLGKLSRSTADERDLVQIRERVDTVADGARCFLASQQEVVVGSLLERFAGLVEGHLDRSIPGVEPALVAELVAIDDGTPVIDERFRDKQPDWTYDETYSGRSPADRLDEHRSPQALDG